MKNFKLFLESKELEQLFQQEVIEGDVTITHRIDNIKTKKINGRLIIKTIDYGDLRDIQVDEISFYQLGITELINLPQTLKSLYCYDNEITNLDNLPLTLKKIVYKNTPIHNLVKKYDANGNDINLAFLIQTLKLDSYANTEEHIHPILDILKPEDYKQCSELLSNLNINLNTHSTNEIINIISNL